MQEHRATRRRRVQGTAFGLAMSLVLATGAGAQPRAPDARDAGRPVGREGGTASEPANFRTTTAPNGFTVAAVGDLVMKFPAMQWADTKPVADILQRADVAVGNMETLLIDVRKYAATATNKGALWSMTSDPLVAKDLKEMGFDMVGRANNQASGYGVEGMRETDKWLDEAGIRYAGTGETLALARAAQYLHAPGARVALVSAAETFDAFFMAQNPNGMIPGHPGLAPIRMNRFVIVTPERMKMLREMRDEFPGGAPQKYDYIVASQTSNPVAPGPDKLSMFGTWYKVGEKPGYSYEVNKQDEHEILQSIKNGKANADFLVITVHNHQGPSPVDAIRELAHKTIDAGADMWLGHGPHVVRGIEIYKGRPIFYSLGDFFFEVDMTMQPIPQAHYEGRQVDPNTTTDAEYTAMDWSPGRPELYESVIAVSKFDNNRLSEVRLYPVDLGWGMRSADRGRPRIAGPQIAQKILKRMQELSEPLGTTIKIEGNVGVIRIPPSN